MLYGTPRIHTLADLNNDPREGGIETTSHHKH